MDTEKSNNKILIFAGTYEGHALAELAAKKGYPLENLDFSVATDYGSEIIGDVPGLNVLEGRLDKGSMTALMDDRNYTLVIDATHPYATEVTANLKDVCKSKGIEYLRVERSSTAKDAENQMIMVKSIEEAVDILNKSEDKVLLTTGSKELSKYSGVDNLKDRLFPRILPTEASLKLAAEAGFPSKNIIAMQGPFSKEMNVATMNQYGCRWIVTKDTGKPGGFEEKASLARMGYNIIVIGRPDSEKGVSFEAAVERMREFYE